MKMERKNNEVKLPAIQSRVKDNSNVLSNTMPDNTAKTRPSSLNKVEDLEKKLFSKLDAYETFGRKGTSKRASRTRKLQKSENGFETQSQGYQKLQKLMPSLYNKLLQAKKGSLIDMTPSTIETPSYRSQARISSRQQTISASTRTRQEKQISIFVTSKESKQIEKNDFEISQEEMNEMYEDYLRSENLGKETSSKDLEDLGKSIVTCQKQIEQLTKSMQSLIQEIGLECVCSYQQTSA